MVDRLQSSGPYAALPLGKFPPEGEGSYTVLRGILATEFARIAAALNRKPDLSLDLVPQLWRSACEIACVTGGTAPATDVRGICPVAVFGKAPAGSETGNVAFRVAIPGVYSVVLKWGTDATAGGFVFWDVLWAMYGEGGAVGLTADGASLSVPLTTPEESRVVTQEVGRIFVPDPCVVALELGRDYGNAGDTCTADAYVVGVGLERVS